jgi:tetratricopeptide (TPR) repeat protein
MHKGTLSQPQRLPPVISVVMPVFNGVNWIDRAILSVIGQTFSHWELLAVNDASTDESATLLAQWARSDRRIRVIELATNHGPGAARNRALTQARGDFVVYLDCFDEYYPHYLDCVQSWPTPAEVCLFCYDVIEGGSPTAPDSNGLTWDPMLAWKEINEANISCPLGIAHRLGLVKRSGMFEEKMRHGEDWDLLKRFARSGTSFFFRALRSGFYRLQPRIIQHNQRLADLSWNPHRVAPLKDPHRPSNLVSYQDVKGAALADNYFAQGTDLAKKGQRDEAISLFRKALRLRPEHAKTHHNMGVALAAEKTFLQAIACFRSAIRYQPKYVEAYYGLGNALLELEQLEDAANAFQSAVNIKPDNFDACNNLGLTLNRLGRADEAVVILRQAVRLKPNLKEAHNHLGLAYMEAGDFVAAEASFENALRLNPLFAEAHTNLGSAFKERGRIKEALTCYNLALAVDPNAVTPHWNRSLAWLQLGNYEQGWREYEWRWKRKETKARRFPEPQWDGTQLHGDTILLYMEQGFGDMLQFIRYAPMVAKLGGRVIVAAPPQLTELFSTCPGIERVISEKEEPPPFDYHASIMTLPSLFQTTLLTVPDQVPYLAADPVKMEIWRERLSNLPGFKVGIAWQGNPRHKLDRYRSISLSFFEPLSRVNGVTLVSLQKGLGTEQLPIFHDQLPVVSLKPEISSYNDTAAIMKCLDLVVCCDTSVAHLAGALGTRVWVTLATVTDWRWLLDRTDSPWYPTMRLFRQDHLGDWRVVFDRIASELRNLVCGISQSV